MQVELTDIQYGCTHDGPGIRTVLFFKGCPLSCRWCHNPEAMSPARQVLYRPYKCIGCGRCAAVCPQGAIRITEQGVASVDPRKCTGCGMCERTCPNGIIHLVRDTARVVVKCSNHDKGAAAMKVCKNSCIACGKCERVCPEQAIRVENNLAVIDYERCIGCGLCREACPRHSIQEGNLICGAHLVDPIP